MLKKIDYLKKNIDNNNLLICPICNNNLYLDENSLKCENNHCFDISKKGYVTLLKHNKKRVDELYDSNLFINRIEFINSGFYDEMHKIIASKIKPKSIIADLGCGDGTHDNKINDLIDNCLIIGIDLAKDGINLSTRYLQNNFIPIIADLNYLPIKDNSIDVILNILSPSNEKEIRRVLKKDGIIIKVTPKKDYLFELRNALSIKKYENEEVIENNIKNNYIILDKIETYNKYHINEKDFVNLVNMTPLTKNYKNNRKKISEITIALNIFVLRIKDQ